MANPELDNYVPPPSLTAKQILKHIVDLNEKYHGKFERAIQAMHEAMDDMTQEELERDRPKRYPFDSPYD